MPNVEYGKKLTGKNILGGKFRNRSTSDTTSTQSTAVISTSESSQQRLDNFCSSCLNVPILSTGPSTVAAAAPAGGSKVSTTNVTESDSLVQNVKLESDESRL